MCGLSICYRMYLLYFPYTYSIYFVYIIPYTYVLQPLLYIDNIYIYYIYNSMHIITHIYIY